MRDVVVVDTGTANLASMLTALRRAGVVPISTQDAGRIASAERVVLPGVGSFGAGMDQLRASHADEAIAERVRRDRPLLGVCLGLQLLCEASDESPGVAGLAVIPQVVRRFTARRVPQLGWNYVSPLWWEGGYAYFANSYRLDAVPPGWRGAMSDHGGPFVAALERGAILACQFHPELSGAWGASLLARWLEAPC
ncbi:MAG TPA: imidazole glycerol phosphate synthase subunit HisH [Polyangiaceae bacterium]|jgi:imidazole glycerol phosphate synthase glutamine amidotransferase subunit|nr:imidazole glycerol phosphate synthase subunit HisH [Polyangiaceae bacterium]